MQFILPVISNEGVFLYQESIPSFELTISGFNIDESNIIMVNDDIGSSFVSQKYKNNPPNGFEFVTLRDMSFLSQADFYHVRKGMGLSNWNRKTQFCGYCGTKLSLTQKKTNATYTYSKTCDSCKNTTFTFVNPAIIVAVTKKTPENDYLLLANNISWKPDRYSIIAGYTDMGEEIIDTVKREVAEEVALEIDNIKFVDTQFFPQPHNLMFGFTAKYKSGQIKVQESEIRDARWVSREDLINDKIGYSKGVTISAKLIQMFIKNEL